MKKHNFYPTWQEASAAAQKIDGVVGKETYYSGYKQDSRLPSAPNKYYKDFPGWKIFVGKTLPYKRWQEASKAVKKIEQITNYASYKKWYKQNKRLHVNPDQYYKDFPGWDIFLDREEVPKIYSTWQQTSGIAKELVKANGDMSYEKLREMDERFPSSPGSSYSDFPGMDVFLGKDARYPTWQIATRALQVAGGIIMSASWKELCDNDLHLPKDPEKYYYDFPGWDVFLCKEGIYPTWQDASEVIQKCGIVNSQSYKKLCKVDMRLPLSPSDFYSDFPGWHVFFGRNKYYPTWQEASVAVRRIEEIVDSVTYKQFCSQDPQLPLHIIQIYKDFPSFDVFLGIEKQELYPTWQQASIVAKELVKVNGHMSYEKLREMDRCFPCKPGDFYPDFPGMKIFLGGDKIYPTCQEASAAVKKVIKKVGYEAYEKLRVHNSRLPADPGKIYSDFPGMRIFLGKGEIYPTWQEALKAAENIDGMFNPSTYFKLYKQDICLPHNPEKYYDNFPGWDVFLEGVSKFYLTWQEASRALQKIDGITDISSYLRLRKVKDKRLPSNPRGKYSDFPGWDIFLCRK